MIYSRSFYESGLYEYRLWYLINPDYRDKGRKVSYLKD